MSRRVLPPSVRVVGAGLLYAGLLAAWAVVGIQFLVRRHDEVSSTHSVDRFSHAMRILSRRTDPGDQRTVVMPARALTRPAPDGAAADATGDPGTDSYADFWDDEPLPRVQGHARMVARRRRVLLILLCGLLGLAVASAFAGLSLWVLPPVGVVLAGYLVHLRAQARQEAALRRRRRAARARLRARERRIDSAERVVATRRVRETERMASLAEAEAELAVREAEDRRTNEHAAKRAWNPVPVPLPTYVTKPKATRSNRFIDLTRPAWVGAPTVEGDGAPGDVAPDAPGVASGPAQGGQEVYDRQSDAAYDDDADAVVDRRAVGD